MKLAAWASAFVGRLTDSFTPALDGNTRSGPLWPAMRPKRRIGREICSPRRAGKREFPDVLPAALGAGRTRWSTAKGRVRMLQALTVIGSERIGGGGQNDQIADSARLTNAALVQVSAHKWRLILRRPSYPGDSPHPSAIPSRPIRNWRMAGS